MQGRSLFLQNVIALIWDFDGTLIPGNMQEPVFKEYKIDEQKFWEEVAGLPSYYKSRGITVSRDSVYLTHILTYVREGIFEGLSNTRLKELGTRLKFYKGLPEFLGTVEQQIEEDPEFKRHEIKVEHYVVSTGIKPLIEGSAIAQYLDGIWACEFIEEVAPPEQTKGKQIEMDTEKQISQIGYMIDNTTKTRAVFEINKGTNKDERIDVNASIRQEDRRVPFQNMIFIADGPSDVPVFSIINHFRGHTFAVYEPGSKEHFAQVDSLQRQGRVQGYGEANYQERSQAYMWITHTAESIAKRIVGDREQVLKERVQEPPSHIVTYSRDSHDNLGESGERT